MQNTKPSYLENIEDALEKQFREIKKCSEKNSRNFSESVDVVMNLNKTYTESELSSIRGTISLPHGTGKKSKVAVFLKDLSKKDEILNSGALEAGGDDLVSKIDNSKINFDFCICSSDSMQTLSKIAKKLGPRGIMPNQKDGTISLNPNDIVKDFVNNRIRYRSTKQGVLQFKVGNVSMSVEQLKENFLHSYGVIKSAVFDSLKAGSFLSIYVKTTMGKSHKI